MVLFTGVENAQMAVDAVKKQVIERPIDTNCPVDAPVNKLRGFRLTGVKKLKSVNVII